MGTLRDEAYEKLDYLSQLTEVVIAPQEAFLNRMPERIELSIQGIRDLVHDSYSYTAGLISLSRSSVLFRHLVGHESTYVHDIESNFAFEASDDFEVDFENGVMTGTLALVKKSHQMDEKKLLQFAVNTAVRQLSSSDWPIKRLKERIITVLNTLEANCGNEWASKLEGRVGYQGRQAVGDKLKEVILDNKWRVRDSAVIAKIGEWINSYLSEEENSTGLVNLIKLKIMLDKDLPVYSIDEVKNADPA